MESKLQASLATSGLGFLYYGKMPLFMLHSNIQILPYIRKNKDFQFPPVLVCLLSADFFPLSLSDSHHLPTSLTGCCILDPTTTRPSVGVSEEDNNEANFLFFLHWGPISFVSFTTTVLFNKSNTHWQKMHRWPETTVKAVVSPHYVVNEADFFFQICT